jgi:5'-nucleotidase
MKTPHTRLFNPLLLGAIALLAVFHFTPTGATPVQQEPRTYRILIANDDGIEHQGILELVKAMSKVGEVVVAAPPANRSGASHSSTMLSAPMKIEQRKVEGAVQAWAVDGTPSDCVAFGVRHLGVEQPFDLVVSGINGGSNVGLVAHYSGTVGAAMEGAMNGIPSFAISMERGRGSNHFKLAAAFAADFARKMLAEGADASVIYNINVPSPDPAEITGVAIAAMGGLYLESPGFHIFEDGAATFARATLQRGTDFPADSDTSAYYQGKITVAPLRVNLTDTAKLAELTGWQLKPPTPK